MVSQGSSATPRAHDRLLMTNASLLNPREGRLERGRSLLIEEGRVRAVGGAELSDETARTINVRDRTVMPGLVDAHVHVCAVTADLSALAEWSPAYVAARSATVMRGMLSRGFTTVRDVAGADYGLSEAVAEGYFEGPRLVFGGKALSQTGGHGDGRPRGRDAYDACYCHPALSRLCDGVPEVRKAAREEIRRGARHLKLMLSGGVASPTDRVDSNQFSLDEIRAAVEEAENANLYVAGHAYTASAINRALKCGVRCIEHGNLLDQTSIDLFLEHDAFYVPTLVTYAALAEQGLDQGLPPSSHRKVFEVLEAGQSALELAHRAGLQIVFGTDLLGDMHARQLDEFRLRSEVQPAADIIRAATTTAARLLRMEGQIGELVPGAFADLLVVDGDPLRDVRILTDPDRYLLMVLREGQPFTDRLTSRD